jgi:hypothetical protein
VATKRKRREAARLQRQLEVQRREEAAAARRRRIVIASAAAATCVVLAAVIVGVVALTNDSSTQAAAHDSTASPSASPSTPTPTPSVSARPAKGPAVAFRGVNVKGAADLGGAPGVTSKSSTSPTTLAYKDLVVGKGKAANPQSNVTVQYVGALYKDGKVFDSSWSRGTPAQFSLTGVVKGFTQGIGGTKGIPPMKVGGRRLMILPAALGYGSQANGSIPANSPLVFVVDLKSIAG